MSKTFHDSLILAVDSHCGVYAPQVFIERYGQYLKLTDSEQNDMLEPYNEFYWHTWEDIVNKGIEIDGIQYSILQNEDVWLLPSDIEVPEDFWI